MKPLLKKTVIILGILIVLLNIILSVQAYRFIHYYDESKKVRFAEMNFFEKLNTLVLGQQISKEKVVDSLRVPHAPVTLYTSDGIRLACWNLQHPATDQIKGTVLMFHGHGSCKSGIIPDATFIYNLGWNVFMADARAHGESSGNTCTIGYKEALDVKTVYDHVKKQSNQAIILYGVSMGAATITKAIYDYPEIKPAKIILESPFATMTEASEGKIRSMNLPEEPLTSILMFWGSVETGCWLYNNKPAEYIKKVQCPVLLQWGKDDNKVLEKEIKEIYQNIPVPQKQLVVYENCGHESICRNNFSKWSSTITSFLK